MRFTCPVCAVDKLLEFGGSPCFPVPLYKYRYLKDHSNELSRGRANLRSLSSSPPPSLCVHACVCNFNLKKDMD